MSESVVTDTTAAVDPVEPGTEPEPKEIDWKSEARKHEARAKENAAKAKANEGAAQRLAEIEEANKTAEQKANERLAAAEQRAAELEASANRATAANDHGIPVAILSGPKSSSPEDLSAYAEELIAFRGEQKQAPKSDSLSRVNQSSVGNSDELATARSLFGNN